MHTLRLLLPLAGLLASLALAPQAMAGQIVYARDGDVWTMDDDGSNQQLFISKADTPTFVDTGQGTIEQVESLSEPSVDEPSGTILFDGYYDSNPDPYPDFSCGLHCTGLYTWQAGVITRISLDPANFPDIINFESEPEPFGDGTFAFANTICDTSGYGCASVEIETLSQGDTPEGGHPTRTQWNTKCDDTLYVESPSPNPVNPAQIAYTGCDHYDSTAGRTIYEMLVSGRDRAGEIVVSSDDYNQRDPSWRADGQKLVAVEEGTNPGIYEFNPAATNSKRLVVAAPTNYVLESPRYTGDGRIVFQGKTGASYDSNIYAVSAACNACAFPGGVTQLTFDNDSRTPDWTGLAGFDVAGQAAVAAGVLGLDARDGEANQIVVGPPVAGRATNSVQISDARGIEPGAGCTEVSATAVSCADVDSVAIDGKDGNDSIAVQGATPATLTGGSGNDTLSPGTAADTVDGGPGTDTISYASRTAAVAVKLDGGRNDGADPNASGGSTAAEEGDRDIGIEHAIGGTAGDRFVGSSAVNVLTGGGGDDLLDGGLGGDTLDGGTGTDTITYASRTAGIAVKLDQARNDGADPDASGVSSATEEGDRDIGIEHAIGGTAGDRFVGSSAVNVLTGGGGDDLLDGGLGGDTLDGGTGTDTITYASRTAGVAVKLDQARNDGADPDASGVSSATEEGDRDIGIEHAIGGTAGDRFVGSSAVNVLTGGGGDDLLDGGLGGDTLDGGTGTDTITYASRTAGIAVKLDQARNDGADPDASGVSTTTEEGDRDIAIENATGGSAADRLFAIAANATVNRLTGGSGNDWLYLREGTGTVDVAICGIGTDRYRVDPSDTRSSCETALP